MSYTVNIEIDEPYAQQVDAQDIERLVAHVLGGEGIDEPAELSIWITGEAQLHELNRQYREVDNSTDVLSFGADGDAAFVAAPGQPRYLGDLAVSFPHVARQAEEYGHARQRELGYLVTHGILHLLGYDHEQNDDAAAMRGREESLLGALGITRDEPRAD